MVTYFHFPNTTPIDGVTSTLLGYQSAKIAVDSTDGAVVVFDGGFWSARHSGFNASGSGSSGTVFYRQGTSAPNLTYAVTTDADKASLPIVSGQDEVIKTAVGQNSSAVFFKAASGTVVLLLRRNEVHGLNAKI